MFNILVTGAKGQLGRELEALSGDYPFGFFFTCKDSLDITDNACMEAFIVNNKIDTIINCAAYTAVDKAQNEENLADKINHEAVKNLALLSQRYQIKLIHISTDYVFDGRHHKPYTEADSTQPTCAYGKTKRDGENALQAINPPNSIIIRTSWLYSAYGANFVKTMVRLGKEKEELGVVYDQIGTPTYAKDLAKVILDILPKIQNSELKIYHYSNEGVVSWYDFAKEIMRMAKLACKVNPIETDAYPTLAQRPHFSVLNKSKIKNEYAIVVPYWKDSLDACLKAMKERR